MKKMQWDDREEAEGGTHIEWPGKTTLNDEEKARHVRMNGKKIPGRENRKRESPQLHWPHHHRINSKSTWRHYYISPVIQ